MFVHYFFVERIFDAFSNIRPSTSRDNQVLATYCTPVINWTVIESLLSSKETAMNGLQKNLSSAASMRFWLECF